MNIDALLLLLRITLALVFGIAGVTKLFDSSGSRKALADFGVPAVLVRYSAILLPITEIIVAVALLPTSTAWIGAIAALILLWAFIIGITINLLKGRTPDCHCFGQLHSAPIGWKTLFRNGLLALIATFIVWQGPRNQGLSVISIFYQMALWQMIEVVFSISVIIVIAIQSWLIWNLLRQNGRLLIRIEALETPSPANTLSLSRASITNPAGQGLAIGTVAPRFQLPDLEQDPISLDALCAIGKPVLLIFSDPNCGPCQSLMPQVGQWQREYGSKVTIVIISRGAITINRDKSIRFGLTNILVQQNREVANLYQAHGTPSAVIIRSDIIIGSNLASGADAITALVEEVAMSLGLKRIATSLASGNGISSISEP